ncbi:MAG: RelA/SpoT domain protein [Chitinophagaceae bacterium]|nr:RelA/SpoT domain protein [Chitinophagaceae bacterium]
MITQKDFFHKYNISELEFRSTGLKWKDLEKIHTDFEDRRKQYEPTAKDIAERLLQAKKVHSVRYRVKESEHVVEKIIRKKIEDPDKSYTLQNYFSKLTDIIGVRALHLFKDDWEIIDEYIVKTWETKEIPIANIRKGDPEELTRRFEEKGYEIKEHKYGYRSVHYIIETSPTKQSFTAELQVRTIFEEGWSEIDHNVRYPYDLENPLLKQYLIMFNRLAGNADEMGTYLKYLQHELTKKDVTHHNAIIEREKMIDDLKQKIDTLKIDKATKLEIGSSLDHLFTRSKESVNGSPRFLSEPSSLFQSWHSCERCGEVFNQEDTISNSRSCEACRGASGY